MKPVSRYHVVIRIYTALLLAIVYKISLNKCVLGRCNIETTDEMINKSNILI